MKDSWTCRSYRDTDWQRVLVLYREVNGREMPSRHQRWRFSENPFGKGIIRLMFDAEKLVGHYAVAPMNLYIRGVMVKAALSVNTMTHPDYERQGIFTYLACQTYERCLGNFTFVYGFPNENSYHGFVDRLGWTGFGKVGVWRKSLRDNTSTTVRDSNIREVDEFDTRVDCVWNKVRNDRGVAVPRTKDFLNWRFANHPARLYPKYIITGNSDEVLGYLVLKTYTGGSEPEGHIVDMLCVDDRDTVKSLLNYAHRYFADKKVRNLSCWIPSSSFYARVLEEEGFTMRESETYFGVKPLGGNTELLQTISQPDNWHLTMCDSDVF